MRGWFRLLRPQQWIKNGFVFAPLVFAVEFLDIMSVMRSSLAAALFCLAASAIYIINDLRDVEADRRHPKKSKQRPLAAGTVSVRAACITLAALCALLAVGGFFLPEVMPVIGMYLALNIAYTFILKRQPVLDILSIAVSFVLRVQAGSVALDVSLSAWMFATTFCLALFLATVKRRQEIVQSGAAGREVLEHYSAKLMEHYMGIAATCALVFYSLFVLSDKPELTLTIPFVFFGVFRYWYVAEELQGEESPTEALLTDGILLLNVCLWLAACMYALLS